MAGVKYGRKSTRFLNATTSERVAQGFAFVGTHGGGPLNRALPCIRQMSADNIVDSPPNSTSREWNVGDMFKRSASLPVGTHEDRRHS